MMKPIALSGTRAFWLLTLGLLLLVGWVYWPVYHADFIWIDKQDFIEHDWLTHGELWKQYIFRGFNGWTQYFRPLVVGLFTLQLRLFDAQPGPMHLVTLGMHLGNVLLVGLLARRCSNAEPRRASLLGFVAMLLYGLHPMLIEPVAWIGCQFEQVINLLVLAALLANTAIRSAVWRAAVVTVLFFLAACAKESAVALPPLLVLFDWLLHADRAHRSFLQSVKAVWRRSWMTYLGIVVAGVVYLVFRDWALGALVSSQNIVRHQSLLEHVQEVCFLYVHYWGSLFSPTGMSIVHEVDTARFAVLTPLNALIDVVAVGILALGAWWTLRRASVLGVLIMAVTVSLFPVLHVVAVAFDASLYHERYGMMALAVACVLVMRIRLPAGLARTLQSRSYLALCGLLLVAWSAMAVLNIRAALPFWANDLALWQWAVKENPRSATAINNLLTSYFNAGQYGHAKALLAKVEQENIDCPRCTLNQAVIAIAEHDYPVANHALQKVRANDELVKSKNFYRSYLFVTAQLLIDERKFTDAHGVLREALRLSPQAVDLRVLMVRALSGLGRLDQARAFEAEALASMPERMRAARKRVMDRSIAAGAAAGPGGARNGQPAPVGN